MNVIGKLMSMDCLLNEADGVELQVVGVGKEFCGGEKRVEMALRLQAPRALVKDYKLGDKFNVYLAQAPEEPAKPPTEDIYEACATRAHFGMLMGGDMKATRDVLKEAFQFLLREHLQDPVFRATIKRELEIAEARAK